MHIALVDSVHPVLAEKLTAAGHACTMLHTLSDAELKQALGPMQGIVVRSRVLSGDLLASAPGLRFVARVGAGLENIDRAWCQEHGILVLNSPEGNRDGVAEWCVAQLLALMKHLHRANAQVHSGLWLREENRGHDLFASTVGIIGYGQMGSAFALRLGAFGVQVLAHDKYRTGFASSHVVEASLGEVLTASDAISLHLPLTEETRHFANKDFFQRLGRSVWFINSSRGGVVDTKALLDALDAGLVKGAALDVLEYERPDLSGLDPAMDPHTQARLLAHPGVLLSPHIAGVTHEGKEKMARILAEKILHAFPSVHDPA